MAVVIERTTLTGLVNRIIKAERLISTLSGELQSLRESVGNLMKDEIPFDEMCRPFSPDPESSAVSRDKCDSIPKKRPCFDFRREGDYVVAYTDGACENNGKPNARAGYGVWFGHEHPLNVSRPLNGKATNNRAEIQACTAALAAAKDNGVNKMIIRTDSQFTINCTTQWMGKWKQNNWKLATGGPVKNKEELMELDKQCSYMEDVKWEYVAGHKGIQGNEEADKLARQGALMYRRN